ncbi:MAG: IS66 family insertion sequence element accessory protein TnpA, partial [Mangrovibacterium sp.]
MLNAQKFLSIYHDYLASGLTVRDYCANQHMNEARFYYWQNKLKDQLPPKQGFIPVVF